MDFITPPYLTQDLSVRRVMLSVLAALLPGVMACLWLLGPVILAQIGIATASALAAEALMLLARGKPLGLFLSDGSAVVTAWLIALAFPPLAPWWLTAVGAVFAIVVAKQLYGGLGQNPFNPAMTAFAACIVSFPALMSQWPALDSGAGFGEHLALILGQAPRLDAMSGATPLDALKTALRLGDEPAGVAAITAGSAVFGHLAGRGWEWVSLAHLVGGLWLLWRGIIGWRTPAAFLAGLAVISGALWLWRPESFADPLFHLFSGGSMLGAFFIVTDPVTSCATPRGKLIFGFSAGALAYLIRVFGGYPDGVAFATLMLNVCAPLIDSHTRPPIFGMKK
ncbi:MAG: RnfABCDGE type electron transport complex subunit D [Candidatus Accumulibacter sp.]|jgi:electron transport complex protein RnfD|nr:RnfABCDGE type electron transport complex subunit D [Accumulibacter sp.]